MKRLNYLTNQPSMPLDDIIISMIDLKNIGVLRMDTCSCEAVETQTIKTTDDEGHCTCDTETRIIEREYYCNCDDN